MRKTRKFFPTRAEKMQLVFSFFADAVPEGEKAD